MDHREISIQISGLKKRYKLGQVGGATLQEELQSWWARKRGKEDPNSIIGSSQRRYGEIFMALNGIDLKVYKGETVGIIGKNGAGKSTLLKLISRVTAPTEGKIGINGRITSMLEVGTGFSGEMTGRENIYMNGSILGMSKREVDEKIEQIIEFSEVREFIDTPVKRYSSGMYVKLAFAVAAHLDSEIMIMDEVLAVGDMAFQKKCLDKMRKVAAEEGRTVLYVSHNMNTIRQLCNRCIVLDEGKIIYDGAVNQAIEIYLGDKIEYSNYYEYTKEQRSDIRSSNNFVIKSLEVKKGTKQYYQCGDRINLDLKFESKVEQNKIYIRFEIYYKDETVVGTMLSENTFRCIAGRTTNIGMQMDTKGLMPGEYYVYIVAYLKDNYEEEIFLDGVYPGFSFELKESKQCGLANWNHRWWGHIRLQDIKVSL